MAKQIPNPSGAAIIKTLCYFSIFRHPLTFEEICLYCQFSEMSPGQIEKELDFLEESGIIEHKENYYFIRGEESFVSRRLKGETMTPHYLKKAQAYSRLIAGFPYVQAVFISGSLSKGYMDEDSDIDYFIITKPGRLWLCRSLLVLFKKIFLLNSRKYFCVNYFIDSDNLKIPDENIFTATELVFVLPMFNIPLYEEFRKQNKWTEPYYPNIKKNHINHTPVQIRSMRPKKILERFFDGNTGERMDNWFFKKTIRYWKNKFKDFDETVFDMQLRSRKNVSKHHPKGFQQKVLLNYETKIKQVSHQFGLDVDHTSEWKSHTPELSEQ